MLSSTKAKKTAINPLPTKNPTPEGVGKYNWKFVTFILVADNVFSSETGIICDKI